EFGQLLECHGRVPKPSLVGVERSQLVVSGEGRGLKRNRSSKTRLGATIVSRQRKSTAQTEESFVTTRLCRQCSAERLDRLFGSPRREQCLAESHVDLREAGVEPPRRARRRDGFVGPFALLGEIEHREIRAAKGRLHERRVRTLPGERL